jgi:hypothetical protein
VVCHGTTEDGGGLCDAHKYDEQKPAEPAPMVITHLTANVRDPNTGEGRWANHRIGWLPEEGWFCCCTAEKTCPAIAVVQQALSGAVGNAERPARRGAGGKAPRKPKAAQKALSESTGPAYAACGCEWAGAFCPHCGQAKLSPLHVTRCHATERAVPVEIPQQQT